MKVGVWGARADRRGLANQLTELCRRIAPDKIYGVAAGGIDDWSVYDARKLTVGTLRVDKRVARRWLADLDVVWAAETFYHDAFVDWARDAGVGTVLHLNPEFYRGTRATVLATPSSWRLAQLPPATVVLPSPVPDVPYRARDFVGELLLGHVAGHPAVCDRNGTQLFVRAFALLARKMPLRGRIYAQRPLALPSVGGLEVRVVDLPDASSLYDEIDVLVLPRRYGGQSLVVQEAVAHGVVPVMLDVEPQRGWLPRACLVAGAAVERQVLTAGGLVDVYGLAPARLADHLEQLLSDRARLRAAAAELRDGWLARLQWPRLAAHYAEVLAAANSRI